MPINIFDDQPARTSSSSGPAYNHDPLAPPPRSNRGPLLLAGLATVVAMVGVGLWQAGLLPRGGADPATATTFLARPAPPRAKGACIDASSSSGDGGTLARTALTTTVRILDSWVGRGKVSGDRATDPQPGLTLAVRVVQANSFTTSGGRGSTALVQVPAVAGLTDAAPVASQDRYLELSSVYDRELAQVRQQATAARRAVKVGATDVRRLVGQTSTGSDVTGCVLALADILGVDSDILVVSDLQDTRFTAPGDARLTGRMDGVRLFVAQSCPSGDPARCARDQRAFVDRLRPLGLAPKRVQAVRPELGADIVHTWLGR